MQRNGVQLAVHAHLFPAVDLARCFRAKFPSLPSSLNHQSRVSGVIAIWSRDFVHDDIFIERENPPRWVAKVDAVERTRLFQRAQVVSSSIADAKLANRSIIETQKQGRAQQPLRQPLGNTITLQRHHTKQQ